MQETLQLGRFTINAALLILLISGIFGYLVLKLRLKEKDDKYKVLSETIIDIIFVFALIWKLSYFVFHPLSVIHNPLSLLYFSGGLPGVLLAVALTGFYIYRLINKHSVSIWIYLDLLSTWFLAASLFYNFAYLIFGQQYLLYYGSRLILDITLLYFLLRVKSFGLPKQLNQLLLWYSFGMILTSHFENDLINFNYMLFNIPAQTILLYGLALFSVLVLLFKE